MHDRRNLPDCIEEIHEIHENEVRDPGRIHRLRCVVHQQMDQWGQAAIITGH